MVQVDTIHPRSEALAQEDLPPTRWAFLCLGSARSLPDVEGLPGSEGISESWACAPHHLELLAESMGAFGIRVTRPGDIQSAIEQALASGRPAIVDVVTDPADSEAPVPWAP